MNKIDVEGNFIPMYRELVERLGNDILNGEYRDGDFFCTMKEVCSRYKVSITTARKAISCMVESQILICKSSRGIYIRSTLPLKAARLLSNTILICEGHSGYSSYFSLRLGAMLREFSAAGYTTQIVRDDSLTHEMLEMVANSMSAVVFNTLAAKRFDRFVRSAHRCPILLEHFMQEFENVANLIMVKEDFQNEIRQTIDFFSGKKQIVAVISDRQSYIQRYQDAFRNADWKLEELEIDASSMAAGRAAVDRLAQYPSGTGFWVQEDHSALGIWDGFMARGRDLRTEHAILASANPRFDYTMEIGLPIIGSDPICLGSRAARELCKFLKTGAGNRLVDIPIETNFNHGDPGDTLPS